jgi:hypothetical protein
LTRDAGLLDFSVMPTTARDSRPHLTRVRLALISLVGLASVTGCVPLISHPPKVERGFRYTGSYELSAVQRPRTMFDSVPPLNLGFGFAVRTAYGFRDPVADDGLGIELGLEAGFTNGLLADLYAQAPTRWTGAVDAGVGIAGAGGAYRGAIAYAQAGRRFRRIGYVYTTHGISWLRHSRDAGRPLRWQPLLAMVPFDREDRTVFVYAGAIVGPTVARCSDALGICEFPIFTASPMATRAFFGMGMLARRPRD